MQTSFGCNMLALNGGKPETADAAGVPDGLPRLPRRGGGAPHGRSSLRKARDRAHVLCGLAVAVSNVDEVVRTIRASADAAEAREKLMTRRWPAEEISALHQG